MSFRLVDSGWGKLLDEALQADHSRLRIISPFIKLRAVSRLLKHGDPTSLQVITRYDLNGFLDGVSDVAALRLLLQAGAQVRGVRDLHAKVYLVGSQHAIVTSANLTEQALTRNHEFGFCAEDLDVVGSCHTYFETLWKRAGANLTVSKLNQWEREITTSLATGAGTRPRPRLRDEGAELGFLADEVLVPNWVNTAEQGFVKFFGEGHNREEASLPVLEEVKRAGCHWACTYPRTKKPRNVRDGAIMFMARLVRQPNDILIFGRGIGMQYREGRDDASEPEIELRPWKAKWPRYVRVHNVEFIHGNLHDGIPLSKLMDELKSSSFASTKRHADEGAGNTDPRKAFNQQAAVELTPEAMAWLNRKFDHAIARYGRISPAALAKLDWPKISLRSS